MLFESPSENVALIKEHTAVMLAASIYYNWGELRPGPPKNVHLSSTLFLPNFFPLRTCGESLPQISGFMRVLDTPQSLHSCAITRNVLLA